MILILLLAILLGGGILAWLLSSISNTAARWVSLAALLADFIIAVTVWVNNGATFSLEQGASWLADVQYAWIPYFNINFHLAMDGISLVMTTLVFFLGIISVLVSWKSVEKHVGFFHFNVLWLLAGITGVFIAMDMMLFYFFWEIMLVPMYFVLTIWGHADAKYAGWKFFLFTQVSGLMMLLAIVAMYFYHGSTTGVYTFDYFQLVGNIPGGAVAFWLMCGFLAAFFTKLPALPFHSWLPDAYAESPAAGSILIAALMSKTAAYGLIRFVVPLFPEAAHDFAIAGLIIGSASILYGAKMAYSQQNLKRLIAYSSFSHMGFILVGVFSFNMIAYQGVLMQMVAHGLSIAGLFVISGFIFERNGITDMRQMGGFWEKMPNMGGFTLVFIMASLGLPGLANFIAEFMVLAGAWQFNIALCVLATLGLIASVTYSMRILQKVFHQAKAKQEWALPDLNPREWLAIGSVAIAILWVGFFPQPIVNAAQRAFDGIVNSAAPGPENISQPGVQQIQTVLPVDHLSENIEKEVE